MATGTSPPTPTPFPRTTGAAKVVDMGFGGPTCSSLEQDAIEYA
jgi:hypothetical protein